MTSTPNLDRPAPAAGTTSIDTVVIGGGQSGLAIGHALARTGRDFVILDAHPRVGDAWRTRWDTLTLFTPSQYNGLPGMRYPARDGTFVTKDAFADYLEGYAQRFDLPVRTSTRVTRLSRPDDRFVVQSDHGSWTATNVVVAMGSHQRPRVPDFARQLAPTIRQLHSHAYRNAGQLQPGPVLLVGAGNSGADIAMDLVRTRETWLAGDPPGVIPFRIETFVARHLAIRLVHFVGHRVLNVANPLGRRVRPKLLSRGTPLIRVKPADLVTAGVRRTGRVVGVEAGLPVTDDGQRPEVANVVWCTGYRTGFSWIDLPVLGDGAEPDHVRGVVREVPGLYVVGLEFLRSETSGTVTGLARDTRHVVRHLDRHRPRPAPSQVTVPVTSVDHDVVA